MRFLRLMVSGLCLAVAGCGSQPAQDLLPPAKSAAKPPKPAIPNATADEIGPSGDPLPPLDGGRLELAAPQGWLAAARDKKYVAQFMAKQGLTYPRILVTVEPAEGTADLTAKTVKAFAQELEGKLNKPSDDEGEAPAASSQPPVTPLRIGERYWAESTRFAHSKGTRLKRLLLVTVAGGRKYTVEMREERDSSQPQRPAALAVANSFKLLTPENAAESKPANAEEHAPPDSGK